MARYTVIGCRSREAGSAIRIVLTSSVVRDRPREKETTSSSAVLRATASIESAKAHAALQITRPHVQGNHAPSQSSRTETSHEPGQHHLPVPSRSISLVQDRPRRRLFEPAPRKLRIGLGPLLPGHPSPVATTARLRDHSARHVISGRILNGRVEIPIEPAATLRPTSRGFLP